MVAAEPRFLADAMVGRLATWLRIMGVDCAFQPAIEDADLVAWARREGRILLTRDTRLLRQRGLPPALFIESDHVEEQLVQVCRAYEIDPLAHPFTRCTVDNTPLRPIAREEAHDRVPPFVFATQPTFEACPTCGRVYWAATQRSRMREELARLATRIEAK